MEGHTLKMFKSIRANGRRAPTAAKKGKKEAASAGVVKQKKNTGRIDIKELVPIDPFEEAELQAAAIERRFKPELARMRAEHKEQAQLVYENYHQRMLEEDIGNSNTWKESPPAEIILQRNTLPISDYINQLCYLLHV
jgi:hypothetical protein